MQISTFVWALARISEVFWAFFWGSKLSLSYGEVFFGGEASTGLGECDPESLQFLFSGSRVVPMLRFCINFFASPLKIEECFLFREAATGFPNFRSRLGLYTTWKPIAYPCDYVSSISHAFNARVLLCRVKSVSNLCFDLFIFQGIASLCFALSNQMPESQIMTNKKPN